MTEPLCLRDGRDRKRTAENARRSRTASVGHPEPTIFEQEGYRFFFYSNGHEPIHVHVRRGGGEAVFAAEEGVVLRESSGLKVQELARAQKLAEQNKRLIIERWHEHIN